MSPYFDRTTLRNTYNSDVEYSIVKKSFSRISFFILTALLLGGFPNFMAQEAFAASITAPDVPRFGTNGDDNVITNAERSTFQIIFNFTTAQPPTVGDTMYLLNGTDALAANFTTPISHVLTQPELDQLSLNFTTADLSGLSDGNYILRGQWVDSNGDGDASTPGNEASTLNLDSDITPTATLTPTPATPSGSKSSLSFAIEFSEPIDPATFDAAADLDIDFDGAGTFANAAGTLSAVDADSYTYTLSAGELALIGTGTPSETVTLRLLTSVTDTTGNALTQVDSVWTFDASLSATNNGGGSGCDDCEAPTLGIDKNGFRHVSNGFTYNGHSVDAERFFTPYPLITANVGKTNTADFKLYENQGISNIRHFTLAFGMDKGDIISDSNAKIELDIAYDGTETVTVTDPENALDNIKVTTNTVSCSDDSFTECLGISIQHRFRAPLDFNIVATDTWDAKRNSWQNYFNHGIEVVGESLNPAKEYDGINRGHIYHLTETSKTTAVDEFGNSWTLEYGLWNKDYVMQEKVKDTSSIMTRMHSEFPQLKASQASDAIEQLLVLCPTCLMPYADFEDSSSLEYSERIDRANNLELQQNMIFESERAQKILEQILDSSYHK